MQVAFFAPAEGSLEAARRLDPDRNWREFVNGRRAWVVQTYLRLRSAGHDVELVGRLPADGLIVFHAADRRAVLRQVWRLRRGILVGLRGHKAPLAIADLEILQNGALADGRRTFAVAHWPQPGLIPRGADRGSTVRRIAYKGFSENLHRDFQSATWKGFLAERSIVWDGDAVGSTASRQAHERLAWNDYREVDLVLGVRVASPDGHVDRPGSKLINAWLAGVPALLGPEVAYRELGRAGDDYIEVDGLESAMAAVDSLLTEPDRYERMVARGRARSVEVDVAATTAAWAELLFERLPRAAAALRPRGGLWRVLRRHLRGSPDPPAPMEER